MYQRVQLEYMEFSEDDIQGAWDRATAVVGFDKTRFRKDACGAWIMRNKYGDTDSLYGWVIDHIIPRALLKEKGIVDEKKVSAAINLRALQHENNTSKSDDYPSYTAVVTSKGAENVKEWNFLQVNKKKQEELNNFYELKTC